MEDLNIDELKQLVNFYKQRSADFEFQVLQLQLKLNRLIFASQQPSPEVKNVSEKKTKTDA